jgi:hypothetical protein
MDLLELMLVCSSAGKSFIIVRPLKIVKSQKTYWLVDFKSMRIDISVYPALPVGCHAGITVRGFNIGS